MKSDRVLVCIGLYWFVMYLKLKTLHASSLVTPVLQRFPLFPEQNTSRVRKASKN